MAQTLLGQLVRVDDRVGTVVELDDGGESATIQWLPPTEQERSGASEDHTLASSTSTTDDTAVVPLDNIKTGTSFVEAVRERYNDEAVSHTVKMAAQCESGAEELVVELVGMEGVGRQLARVEQLTHIILHHNIVSHAGEEQELSGLCPVVTDLSLSYNLLSSWHEVKEITRHLPTLQVLYLTGNKLCLHSMTDALCAAALPSLAVLVLDSIRYVSFEDIVRVCAQLPTLREMHAEDNNISSLSVENADQLAECHHIEVFNLQANQICQWSDVSRALGSWKGLSTLMLSRNRLSNIEPCETGHFPALRTLSLDNNSVTQWQCVDALHSYPALVRVRLKGNPLTSALSPLASRYTIIARLPRLAELNSSTITKQQRQQAEEYFVRQHVMHAEEAPYAASSQILRDLVEASKSGEECQASTSRDTSLGGGMIDVVFFCNVPKSQKYRTETSKRIPSTMMVRELRRMAFRLFGVLPAHVSLRARPKDSMHDEPLCGDDDAVDYYGVLSGSTIIVDAKQ